MSNGCSRSTLQARGYRFPACRWVHRACPVTRQDLSPSTPWARAPSPKRTRIFSIEEATRRPASSPRPLLFGHFLLHTQDIGWPGALDVGEHRNDLFIRSEERRVGKAWVSTCRSR